MSGSLQHFVGEEGGASSLLFYGPKKTPQMLAELEFETTEGINTYHVRLAHAANDALIFLDESVSFSRHTIPGRATPITLDVGHRETKLKEFGQSGDPRARTARHTQWLLGQCRVFQFHDTSKEARVRQQWNLDDNGYLKSDAANLAAILFKLQETESACYQRIVATIRQIAPFFDDFILKPLALNPNRISLRWKERDSDVEFGPHQLSDGTLRAMALVTLLLQPEEDLPRVIIVDEPELGLHPYAICVLASLLKKAACHSQIVLATQSIGLLDHFELEDVVVVERSEGTSGHGERSSEFIRHDPEKLRDWLTEYSLSELWEKNVLGGRPS